MFDRSAEAIRHHARSTAGIVRIAAVPSATVSLLPFVIRKFRKLLPNVRIEIGDVDSAAVRRRVQRDEADIGILSVRPGHTSEGELILRDDLGIVCAEQGPIHQAHLSVGGRSNWSLITLEPLIANPLCSFVDDPIVVRLLSNSTLEARNTTAILSFVRNGLGVSILPFDAVKNQPDGVEFFVPSNPVPNGNCARFGRRAVVQASPPRASGHCSQVKRSALKSVTKFAAPIHLVAYQRASITH